LGWDQEAVYAQRRIATALEALLADDSASTRFVHKLDAQTGDDITVALLKARDAVVGAGCGVIALPAVDWFQTHEPISFPGDVPRTGHIAMINRGVSPMWVWRPAEAKKTAACLRFGIAEGQPATVPYGHIYLAGWYANTYHPPEYASPDWGFYGSHLELYAVNNVFVDRVTAYNFGRGFRLYGDPVNGNVQEIRMSNCMAVGCSTGTDIDVATGIQLIGHTSASNIDVDVRLRGVENLVWTGGELQGNAARGVWFDAKSPKRCQQITIQNVYNESTSHARTLFDLDLDAGSHHIRFLDNVPKMLGGTVYKLRGAVIESRGNCAGYGTTDVTVVDADAASSIVVGYDDVIVQNYGQATYSFGGADVKIEQLANWP
jgi:hypothetical protein